jgi:hypothetical protein
MGTPNVTIGKRLESFVFVGSQVVCNLCVFQMAPIPLLSILIYYTCCQYDIMKVSLKKLERICLSGTSNTKKHYVKKKVHFTCYFEMYFFNGPMLMLS